MLCKRYELKEGARMGPGPSADKEGRVQNRHMRWTPDGVTYEADPRHYEKLVQELGLGQPEEAGGSGEAGDPLGSQSNPVKSVSTPCVKVTTEMASQDVPLPAAKVSHFRGLAARANYLAADRPDIQYAAKEICRWMQEPTELGVQALKRLARYLKGKPRLVFNYPWQEAFTRGS